MGTLWHPCTQMKHHQAFPPLHITRAKGIYLFDSNDRAIIDGISSWWVNIFGHCNEYITDALKKQSEKLDHVLLAGFTHPQILKLSDRLSVATKFDVCFFADNGSSAIEVALKMSYHKNLQLNKRKRPLFITLQNSYHGETLGALGVSDLGLYKASYEALTLKNLTLEIYDEGGHQLEIKKVLQNLGRLLESNPCALILEPLLQCAGGMKIYSTELLSAICEMSRNADVDVIFDEIATGFGRTGGMFAMEKINFKPDFLVLSKGITGGLLPLSVVLTHRETFDAFYDDEYQKGFLHSHSYTGNALACACANATLDLFENLHAINANKHKSARIKKKLLQLDSKKIENKRILGMVCAFDLKEKSRENAQKFYRKALYSGVLLRPLGNVIYFMPPYIIGDGEIDFVFEVIAQTLEEL